MLLYNDYKRVQFYIQKSIIHDHHREYQVLKNRESFEGIANYFRNFHCHYIYYHNLNTP